MIVLNQGMPFELKLPSKTTQKALNELEQKKGKKFDNIEQLFDDLDN
jgi:DNA-damage-inducible protein J